VGHILMLTNQTRVDWSWVSEGKIGRGSFTGDFYEFKKCIFCHYTSTSTRPSHL